MKTFEVYISTPRSEKGTDHNFAEQGVFFDNYRNWVDNFHVVDLSNTPFVRPELKQLASGLKWIINPVNNYPIRGTYNE
jgi:hypothetical protein